MLVEQGVSLAERTTLKLGGPARYFVEATTEEDVRDACALAEAEGRRLWVLGGGSNVVVPDAGLDGVVLAIALRGLSFDASADVTLLRAAAGEPWDRVVEASVNEGLAGLECLSGIPGLTGATPIQNVGAYGQEVAEQLLWLRAYDRSERRFVTLQREECGFSYRESRFKSKQPGRFVVTEVSFGLNPPRTTKPHYPELARALAALGREPSLKDTREAVLSLRRGKSMLAEPGDPNARSCGSFFLNPSVTLEQANSLADRSPPGMPRYPQADGRVKLSAAWLIERAGFHKGQRSGNVGISSKHALALVCHDGASSDELIHFSAHVRAVVEERTGVALSPEPQFL